ncbi:unnamed protein product [Eruca vesicaria subsp. sativa]|uniref:Retrotransposon gag domain-containing protein n=1 Tax=Eruca vesicaria subsp. sativa TaxID=29727 RepID=A0ABC8JM05_ERUVS|nr:unnamed protein product [Eruca vesicaria subsp. sativa]
MCLCFYYGSDRIFTRRMFPLDHYEWRKPRLHYGPRITRDYARRWHPDAGMLPMFPEPEEQYREFPFEYPREQTLKRKMLMPHFQRMAMERRIWQGQATFQILPEEELPKRRGRPSRPPSAIGEPLRVFTGKCQCKTLSRTTQGDRSVVEYTEDFIRQASCVNRRQHKCGASAELAAVARTEKEDAEEDLEMNDGDMVQKPRKVRDYLVEFMETAKKCQPKPAEEWCRLFKAGLHSDIRNELAGVLEPLDFALVKRVAGQALDAEEVWARKNARTECECSTEDDEDRSRRRKVAVGMV